MGPDVGGCPWRSGTSRHSHFPTLGGKKELEIKEVLVHPNYNINGKKEKDILEFYDYDVALIELEKKLEYDQTLR